MSKFWEKLLIFLRLREDPEVQNLRLMADQAFKKLSETKQTRSLDEVKPRTFETLFATYLDTHGIDDTFETKSVWLKESRKEVGFTLSEGGEKEPVYKTSLSLAELGPSDLNTMERGQDGTYYARGLASSAEPNPTFRKTSARGLRRSHGSFYKYWLTSTSYRRGVNNINQAIVTGQWKVAPGITDDMSEEELAEAERRAEWCRRRLVDCLDGGFTQFLNEAVTSMLVFGFALFETVYYGETDEELRGAIKKLAFRFPSTVDAWILDEHERELIAVNFVRPNGKNYVVPAENLLLISYGRLGNNFEGVAPLRSAVRHIETLQLLMLLEAVAAEKFGVPHTYVSSGLDKSQTKKIVDILDAGTAQEGVILKLPEGVEIKQSSPAGAMPNFEAAKRFCIERISEVLSAEGSLIGLGQTGAFAARQSADSEFIRSAPYYAKIISDQLNGSNNTPYSGVLHKMEQAHFGAPLRPGVFSKLEYSVGELSDPSYAQRLVGLAGLGLIQPSSDVVAHIHEKENLPKPTSEPTVRGEESAPQLEVIDDAV